MAPRENTVPPGIWGIIIITIGLADLLEHLQLSRVNLIRGTEGKYLFRKVFVDMHAYLA